MTTLSSLANEINFKALTTLSQVSICVVCLKFVACSL